MNLLEVIFVSDHAIYMIAHVVKHREKAISSAEPAFNNFNNLITQLNNLTMSASMQVQNKLSVFESLASGKQNGDLGLN